MNLPVVKCIDPVAMSKRLKLLKYSSGKWIFVKWLVSIVMLFLELNIPNASSLCHLTDERESGQVYGIRRCDDQ